MHLLNKLDTEDEGYIQYLASQWPRAVIPERSEGDTKGTLAKMS